MTETRRLLERAVDALEKIAVRLDMAQTEAHRQAIEDVALSAAFTMREACAEEAEARWGREAAAVLRAVTLPTEGEQ